MSTAIEKLNVSGELPAIFALARALVKAPGFMPQHLRNEGEITAVILAGRELGIPPMAAIRSIRLIKGNVTLDASMQLALMVRVGCRVEWLDDGSKGIARLQLTRPGQPPYVSAFTLDDAKLAGLTANDTWKKHPAAMLRARCVTAAGKAYCPDVLAGVYLPGELLGDGEPCAQADTDACGTVPLAPAMQAGPAQAGPTKDQVIELMLTDLPHCQIVEDLAAWAREMLSVGGKVRNVPHWVAFSEHCASLEIAPREVVAAAQRETV